MAQLKTFEEVILEIVADNDSDDGDFEGDQDEDGNFVRNKQDWRKDPATAHMMDAQSDEGSGDEGEGYDLPPDGYVEMEDTPNSDEGVDYIPSAHDSVAPAAAPQLTPCTQIPRSRVRVRGGRGSDQNLRGLEVQQPAQRQGPDWQDDAHEIPNWLPNLVCKTPGKPSIDCGNFKPVDFFLSTFPIEIISLIKDETNRYFDQWWKRKEDEAARTGAEIKHADKKTKADWVKTTDAEIKAFIALMIVIGNNKRPNFKSYWSLEWLTTMAGFRSVMSRDRFLTILRFMHVTDNTKAIPRGEPGHDRCFKITPMLKILVHKWQAVFSIDKCTSVHEGMIGFKEQIYMNSLSGMKQYMPKKPTKLEFKALILAGSKTGYVFNWQLHTGKKGDQVEANPRVVLDLSQNLPGGHEVFCDSFFTSYELLQSLQTRGISCCGTVNSNRTSNPQEMNDFTVQNQGKAGLQSLSPIFKRCGDILAVAWYDKQPVTMLSSKHTSEMIVKRVKDNGAEEGFRQIEKPQIVELYNQHIGAVELSDQLNLYNNMVRKSMKWWKKVFFHLLVTSISNAYIMYKPSVSVNRQEGHLFRLEVAKGLLEGWERRTSLPGRPSVGPNPMRLEGRHFIERMEKGRQDCVVCTKREKSKYVRRSQSRYRCKTCAPKVALCLEPPCFELFHTKQDYKASYDTYLAHKQHWDLTKE